MAQYSNRVGSFASHPWQVDKFFGPIYRPTAAKRFIKCLFSKVEGGDAHWKLYWLPVVTGKRTAK